MRYIVRIRMLHAWYHFEPIIVGLDTPEEDIGISFRYDEKTKYGLILNRMLKYFEKRIFTTVHRELTTFYYIEDNITNTYSSINAGTRRHSFFSLLFYFGIREVIPFMLSDIIRTSLEKSPKNEDLLGKQLERMPKLRYRYRDKIRNDVLGKDIEIINATYMFLP